MVEMLLIAGVLLMATAAIGVGAAWLIRYLVRPLILRAGLLAVVRGICYSPSIVVGKHAFAFAPTLFALPQWFEFAQRGMSPGAAGLPAMAVAIISLITSSAGIGIYNAAEMRRPGFRRQSDRDAYDEVVKRLGRPGRRPSVTDEHHRG